MLALLIVLVIIEVLLVRYILIGSDEEEKKIEKRLKQQYASEEEIRDAIEYVHRKRSKANLWAFILLIVISCLIGDSDNILDGDSMLH